MYGVRLNLKYHKLRKIVDISRLQHTLIMLQHESISLCLQMKYWKALETMCNMKSCELVCLTDYSSREQHILYRCSNSSDHQKRWLSYHALWSLAPWIELSARLSVCGWVQFRTRSWNLAFLGWRLGLFRWSPAADTSFPHFISPKISSNDLLNKLPTSLCFRWLQVLSTLP